MMMDHPFLSLLSVLSLAGGSAAEVDLLTLPEGFLMASATSAYQVEGAWNVSDKGLSIWDTFSHNNMSVNGDDACKSYELYKRDVEMLVQTGFNAYRFSISWSRVLPNGTTDYVSSDGVQYYNNLLDELLANNITPMVTLYHWDLPQKLEDMGGWLNTSVADWFEDYADLCFKEFGSKVRYWITLNEPDHISQGYGDGGYAPGYKKSGVWDYMVNHNVQRAHGRAYRLYNNTYKSQQKGQVGISFFIQGLTAKNASDPDDLEAVDRGYEWGAGVYAHAIFSLEGNYPTIVREKVDNNSHAEGLNESRLPHFTDEDLYIMRGAYDFIGLNYYGSGSITTGISGSSPSMTRDAETTNGGQGLSGSEGLRNLLNWLKTAYNDPQIVITETGLSTSTEGLSDTSRIDLYYQMIKGTLEAIYLDGCKVIAFTAWSLMDNMEWHSGYEPKYGIWQVNFSDPNRTRTMKESGYWYQELLSTWRLPNTSYTGAFTEASTATS